MLCRDFNPHEREARDVKWSDGTMICTDFNPHEREARDTVLLFTFERL